MQYQLNQSDIQKEYHVDNLREHKKFLAILEAEERTQKKLREAYAKIPRKLKRKKKAKAIKKKIKPRKKGKQRICFDYETAKHIVRSEGIGSVGQYQKWYSMNSPARMPKNPSRAYSKEWTGWGDFLGVYNEYTRRPGVTTNGRGKFRSFEDAKAFARSLNLKNHQEWVAYTKTGMCPSDIPHRPDLVYSRGERKEYWLSWKDFLGSYKNIQNVEDKIDAVSPVIYVAKKPSGYNNVYVINVIPGGKPALSDHIKKIGAVLIAAFYVNSKFDYRAYVSTLPAHPYGEIDEYLLNNVFEIIEVLEDNLERVR